MKYFTFEEMTKSTTAKRLGIDNSPSEDIKANLKALVENVLDPLREKWGHPIICDSGYRCPKLNKAIGGATGSQHMKGQAADIHTVSDNPEENKKLLKLLLESGIPYDQVINEYPNSNEAPNWIHVSYNSKGNRKKKTTCRGGKYYSGIKV